MKYTAFALAAALLLGAFGLWPFHGQDPAQLAPVQTLVVAQAGEKVCVFTDNGLSGCGENYHQAMEQLEACAPGKAFFGTCSSVVLCGSGALLRQLAADSRLRPAAAVYAAQSVPEAGLLTELLKAHPGSVRLADVRQGAGELPQLRYEDTGWRVYDVS